MHIAAALPGSRTCRHGHSPSRALCTLAHAHPTWTFCHFSAAVLFGLQVPFTLLDIAHVGVSRRGNRRVTSPLVTTHLIDPEQTRVVDGIAVTTILPTLFDCLRYTSFRLGLPIVDSALHLRLISLEELSRYLDANGRALTLTETQRVLAQERRRESHVNLTGATVVRLSYEEATDEHRLAQALELAGVPRSGNRARAFAS